MAESILYRDLIVVTAQFNRATKSCIGRADISYDHNGKGESRRLVRPKIRTLDRTRCELRFRPNARATLTKHFFRLTDLRFDAVLRNAGKSNTKLVCAIQQILSVQLI